MSHRHSPAPRRQRAAPAPGGDAAASAGAERSRKRSRGSNSSSSSSGAEGTKSELEFLKPEIRCDEDHEYKAEALGEELVRVSRQLRDRLKGIV